MPAQKFKFNFNERIKFVPAPYGKKVLEEAFAYYPPAGERALTEGMQFWKFCRVFGPHLYMGGPRVFESGDMVIDAGESI